MPFIRIKRDWCVQASVASVVLVLTMKSSRWPCYLLIYLLLFILGITAQGEAEAAQLSLTWTDNSTYEDGFRIERKTTTNGTFTQIDVLGPDTTAYTDSGLADGAIYCYRVRAFIEFLYSDYSNEICNGAELTSPAPGSTYPNSNLAGRRT